jgi:hypothetical protein
MKVLKYSLYVLFGLDLFTVVIIEIFLSMNFGFAVFHFILFGTFYTLLLISFIRAIADPGYIERDWTFNGYIKGSDNCQTCNCLFLCVNFSLKIRFQVQKFLVLIIVKIATDVF